MVGKVLEKSGNFGFDAQKEEYTDLVTAGIIDPTKVVRTALQDAASIASILITDLYRDPDLSPSNEYYDPDLLPPAESEIDFPIEAIDPKKIKPRYRRQQVGYEAYEEPGTIIVDPANRFLYYIEDFGRAMRYDVGVGRQGFEWAGYAIGMRVPLQWHGSRGQRTSKG